ncbi:MAG: putative ABC exporter domain-containing protein [Opitutaceae bacterium]|nr:putative ABC exporter domain-containing protein [Opitutaceae bacterium]
MLDALIYLRLTSAKNWVLARVRRLRQPKYLIGAVVGFGYFYFFFFRGLGPPATPRNLNPQALQALEAAQAQVPANWLPAMTALGALGLLAILTLMWLVPAQRAALGFTEAEIAFLFPAPIKRTALVHFRLLSAQLRSLVGALVMTLFTHRATILGGNAFTHAVGWWLVFSSLSLHFSGAQFTLTQWAEKGAVLWRRRLVIGAAIAGVAGVTLYRISSGPLASAPAVEAGLRPLAELAIALADTAPLAWLLTPIQLVVTPFLALDATAFLKAIGPAIAMVGLHYLWVVRRAVAFEDAAVDYAQQRAARIAARHAGRSPGAAWAKGRNGPFRLPGTGRPEIAFLWKNLLSTWPYFTGRVWLGAAALTVAGCIWLDRQTIIPELATGAAVPLVIFAAYVLIVGPQFARQDIRSDLGHADILKTYPLAGWQIVLGELLTPAVLLTGIMWLLLLAIAILLRPEAGAEGAHTLAAHTTGAIVLALLTPALALLQLLVPNAAALVFPSWFHATRTRGGGPEVMGQRMIFFFAQLLTMVAALLPAGAVAAATVLALHWLIGLAPALAIAGLTGLAVLVGEVWCGVWWLGGRFEKLDLSAELRS